MNFDIGGIFDIFANMWQSFVDSAMSGLPVSPIQGYMEAISELPYLSYINWFCPIGTCVNIMGAWLTAVGTYYLFSVILRWAKVIR